MRSQLSDVIAFFILYYFIIFFVSCVYSRDALSSVYFFLSWTIFCCLVFGRFTTCLFLVGSRSPCFDLPHTNSVHLAFPSCRGYAGKQRCFVLLNFSTRNWIYFVRNTFICRLGERSAERQWSLASAFKLIWSKARWKHDHLVILILWMRFDTWLLSLTIWIGRLGPTSPRER